MRSQKGDAARQQPSGGRSAHSQPAGWRRKGAAPPPSPGYGHTQQHGWAEGASGDRNPPLRSSVLGATGERLVADAITRSGEVKNPEAIADGKRAFVRMGTVAFNGEVLVATQQRGSAGTTEA